MKYVATKEVYRILCEVKPDQLTAEQFLDRMGLPITETNRSRISAAISHLKLKKGITVQTTRTGIGHEVKYGINYKVAPILEFTNQPARKLVAVTATQSTMFDGGDTEEPVNTAPPISDGIRSVLDKWDAEEAAPPPPDNWKPPQPRPMPPVPVVSIIPAADDVQACYYLIHASSKPLMPHFVAEWFHISEEGASQLLFSVAAKHDDIKLSLYATVA